MNLPKPDQIRAMRKTKGYSQRAAARYVGVTERAWQFWESGERPMSLSAWKLICEAPMAPPTVRIRSRRGPAPLGPLERPWP